MKGSGILVTMLILLASLVELRGVKHYGDMKEITKENWNGHSNKKKEKANIEYVEGMEINPTEIIDLAHPNVSEDKGSLVTTTSQTKTTITKNQPKIIRKFADPNSKQRVDDLTSVVQNEKSLSALLYRLFRSPKNK